MWGVGFKFRIEGPGFRVYGSRFRVWGLTVSDDVIEGLEEIALEVK